MYFCFIPDRGKQRNGAKQIGQGVGQKKVKKKK